MIIFNEGNDNSNNNNNNNNNNTELANMDHKTRKLLCNETWCTPPYNVSWVIVPSKKRWREWIAYSCSGGFVDQQ